MIYFKISKDLYISRNRLFHLSVLSKSTVFMRTAITNYDQDILNMVTYSSIIGTIVVRVWCWYLLFIRGCDAVIYFFCKIGDVRDNRIVYILLVLLNFLLERNKISLRNSRPPLRILCSLCRVVFTLQWYYNSSN